MTGLSAAFSFRRLLSSATAKSLYLSIRDYRVHPGHARKMAAQMIDLGYDSTYYENTEGSHLGSSTNEQLALRLALSYAHLWRELR